MNVSSVGSASGQLYRTALAAPKPAVANDADGDHDGTKPGQVDTDDGAGSTHAVDVRA